MAQEDQSQRCSNSNTSSGGGFGNSVGRSSKKQKPKKVPQRGLGVAQLEKIRLEEQQKKDAAVAAAAGILPSPSSSVISQPTHHKSSSYLSLPIPRWHPGAGVVLPGNGSVNSGHKLWSSREYSIEKECSGLDPGLAFRTNLSLPYESEPIWPPPSLMQRAQPFQQPSSSMVNLSSRTSSTSVLNYQMEPPSNQSYYGNCTPLLPEEEKMVGMKRSYPFSLDNAPGPPLHGKYPPIVHPINGHVEAASSSNGSTFNFEPGTPNFREGPSCSTSNFESKSKRSIRQNGAFDGDFLTLAPPTTTTSMCSSSKFKHSPPNLIYYNCELPGLESLAYQGSLEDSIIRQGGSGLRQYRPYYSFFPPAAMVQIDRATTITMANCNGGEVGGHVDLNLKL
ncbi:PREDICTED: uncharacterized protein LOC18594125 isoform X2 [Theobroma cacao]|uniref:Uncharacterized protein LOC18594125 isoform X2 n=1 Tax=Theobroma cacao TaxID=3641 RepID=A0AB32WP13_THECC|nr:PREDICTED: uncharacterized protein LOC18594125 isoform X2 [Theobroma cacao]